MATDVESYVRFALGLRGAVEVAALQTRYRSPLLEGARALSKAQAAAVEAVEASVSLAKAVLVEGDGGVAPRDGDLVELHLTLRSADDEERVLSSTRAAEGGRGAPAHALLGAACSLLRGVELALGAFSSGERAVLRVPPELAYAHPLCVQRGLSPPRGYPPGCGVLADVELLSFRRAVVVAAPPDAPGLLAKVVLRAGTGLETPHPPYEVEALVQRAALVGAATPFLAAARLRAPLGGALPAFLTQVLSSMRVGEEAEVLVSKQWAGSGGDWPLAAHTPPRWPDGALWRLTLLSMTQVRDMHGDGSLVKRRLAEGSGTFPVDCPLHDCTVTAELQLRVAGGGDGPAPAGEVSTWELGCGAQPPGLEDAIRLMVPGERAAVAAHPRHGYWAQPRGLWAVPPGVGPGDSVEWAVMLLSFQRPLNWHAAEPRACVEDAVAAKEAGVRLYRAGCWALARSRFERVAAQLSGLRGLDGDDEAAALEARRGCLLNAAACCDRLGDHHAAAAHCTVVLQRVDPASAKAHYRRGVSRTATGDWPGAAEDLREAARLDPTAQADCDRALLQLRAAHAKAADTARAQLGGFLDRE